MKSRDDSAPERIFLRALLDIMPDQIYFKDDKSRFLKISKAVAKRFGLTDPEQAAGKSDFDFFTEPHARQAFDDEQQIIKTGKAVVGIEERETWPDRPDTWDLTTKAPLRDETGRIIGTFGISRDITEQKKAVEELAKERALLRSLIDNIPGCAIFVKDRRSRFITTNAFHLQLLGLKEASQAAGKTDFDFFDKKLAEKYYNDEQKVMESGQPLLNQEETTVNHGGNERWLLTSKAPLRGPDGNIIGILGISQDITRRKLNERENRKLEAQMLYAQKLESLGILAGGLAHDFNNLMMAVLGNSSLALTALAAGSAPAECVKNIENAAKQAAALTAQMLAYAGRGTSAMEHVNLASLVHEIGGLLSASIPKHITLKYEFPEKMPPVLADPARMRQVVMNFVTNAAEAIGANRGTITLTGGVATCDEKYLKGAYVNEKLRPGVYVYIEISDTGCGMDASMLKRIFEPFFTTKAKGRGLGLSATLGIIRAHDAALKVYSEVGKGSTFKVLLPCHGEAAECLPEPADSAETWSGSGNVLVLDDDENICRVVAAMLQGIGFKVTAVATVERAFEILRQRADEMNAVLLDVSLPEKDIGDVFSTVRRLAPRSAVILTSGYSEAEACGRFAGKGHKGFIRKPYTLETLRAKMKEILGTNGS